MKKILLFLLFTSLIIAIGAGTHSNHPLIQQPNTKSVSAIRETSKNKPGLVLAKQETRLFYPPRLLSIPKINLTAHIVPVGLDSQKRMDVPNNFIDVGWYDLGYKPGEQGSAVLDGHHDDFNGHPAVFYYLSNLELGDQILVTDQSGKQYTYIVSDKEIYPYDALPLRYIFASNDKARLNIITCNGVWDSNIHNYNQRTVIYSELQSS